MKFERYTVSRQSIFAAMLLIVSTLARPVAAQAGPPSTSADSEVADLTKINAVITNFFEAISSSAGGKIDRARLDALFTPNGRIGSVQPPHDSTPASAYFMTPDQYAEGSDRFTAKYGFIDRVLHSQIERYGLMAHAYSAYESRNDPKDATPMARGIKSIEMLKSAGKWLIVEVYWNSETPDNPLPAAYLQR